MPAGAEALRTLLGLVQDDEPTLRLAREGGHAFVSGSLRPYLIAALAEIEPRRAGTADAGRRRR